MQASKAFVVLLVLSAVSLTLGDYCMPITNTNTANSVCGTLPAATCTPTATSVDGTTYTAANYGTYVNSWAAQKSTICPRNPRLVDDYPLQRFCPDLCTSNYTCQANAYTNSNNAPMCYHLCLQCFDVATCTSWSQNPGNVTRTGVATGCYSSWTHMGADSLQVNDVTPTWGYLKGNQKVVITGCGFTTYSEATCVWGNWHSTNALIVDDNTIHCWTPKVSFVTVPTTTSFQIIFDGTPAITRKLPDFWWGPMITSITPTQVYVAGGTPLTINGFGFSEWTAATTNVTIDGVACTGVSITDTAITCSIPAGSINQNAIVDVYFNGNKYYFAHTYPNTLHYGPLLSSINPTCGHVKGGDTITITGSLFDDPVLNNPRVEFFINGGWWWGSNAVHTGSTITVQTPVPANGFDAWDQNVPITVYGGSPSFAKVPGTASFHYGALLFTVTPTVGYIDGGETVSITGCAFRDYNNSQVTGVFLTTGLTNSLCNLNTVNIVSDNLITCTSVSSTTCFQTGLVVNVGFNDGRQVPAGSQTNVQNAWWWGPKLTVTSLTPSRGPINFLNPVTVTGYKIGRSANTLFATNQATFTAPAVTVNATVGNGQTTMAFSAPTYQWQGVSTVSYSWETCGTYPEVTPQYKWGPSCSSVTPTFGYLGGQQTVTLNGVGFQDQDWNLKTLRARFCTPSAGCNWEQLGFTNVTVTSASTATVSTPNFALAPRNGLGANRYFGDVATVSLFFDTIGVNETQVLSCGSYRYGPIVTGLNPRKGPIGPRADHSPNTAVTVLGAGFQDPLLTNNIRVAFGNIHGETATTTSDTSITVKTLWGARANTDKSVYVYFDTCNTTSSTTSFTWGPQVFNVTPIWGYNAGTNGTNTVITIQGARFQEWYYNGFTDAVCVIDNVYGSNTVIVDDNTITCTVPVRPFGTQAVVQVVFGKTCRGEWDWSQVVQSPTDVYYKPLITGITPTVGYTSGGQTVTISGLGLGNWPNYNCYFGHYKSPATTSPSSLDGSVVCTTPSRREDFNTDVLVHVQLAGDDTVANIGYDFKVWGPTYHYGPICATVSPTRGYFNHDASYQITLSGIGFQDSQWFNQTQPYVLVDGQNVTVVSANDGQVVVNNLTNANSCQQNRTITMWWDKQTQVISCPIYTHGPMVTSSTPDLGWAGDTVTIMGDFLDDPVIYNQLTNVQVTFGSATGTTLSVSQFQITVTAPVNAWLFDAPVSVAWSGYNRTCSALKATDFHYGPIITSITPTFGYVWGRQPVVINGRGFTCCGLSAGTTNCRFAHTEITQDTTTVNGDTQISCSSLGRGSEVTSSATATTTKVVGLSFNGTARILDTDTNAGGRQSTVTYYYGPLVNSVTPTFGRIRGGTTITILGAGFNDPYFMQPAFGALEPVVRFTQSTGGSGVWFINATAHDDLSVTAATLDYIHKCGDADVIALQFYTNSSLTDRFIIPTDNRLTHHYGPLVTSINPSWGYVRGGDTVTITATQLDEWTGRKVRVLFANRESNDADTEFTVTAASTYTAVTPRGSFLHSGPISLILDYKNDPLTTASYWWHWHPYTSSVSQAWGIEGGGFQTTVYGGGFCEYELVTCAFGSTQGAQSDVAYDDRIVCSVPTAAPGTSTISLTFCDYWADCQASYAGSADNVAAFGFTHVGVTSVAPVSGPWVGNTLVTITGTGFDQFTSISVSFGSLAAVSPAGNTTTATQILVLTPAAPAAQTVQVFLTLTYTFSDGVTEQFTIPDRASTPFNFRYDYPAITDIAPASTDVDVTLPVTLTGLYFNGGVLGNIRCYWNVPTKTGTTTLTVNPTAKTDTTLTCAAPTVANGVVLLGGSTVSVSWDGTRKSNIVGFAYTQTPAVTGITPTQGPQYGATRVTVFGNNFNTGISVLCKFSDQVSASVDITYSSTTSTTTTTSTTGATNTTTTGTTASTTGAANTTTTTTGAANTTANGTAPVSARDFGGREVRGTADAIVCLSPRSLSNTFPATAKVEVSLDGGVTWTNTATGVNSFTYQEGFTSTSESATENSTSNTNALVPLISMVFALVIFVVVF